MKETTRIVYRCDYCKKNYLQRHAAVKHEKYCSRNPINFHICFDCIFLEVGRDDETSHKFFHCNKLNKELHTFKAERIGHDCLGHTERMPLTCVEHKSHVDAYFNSEL